MAEDASAALGAPQLAGSFVGPKGLTRSMTARAAGGIVGAALAGGAGAEGTPNFGRVGYLAVSDGELALVKAKSAMLGLKMKPTEEVLARVSRSEVASTELDKGALKSSLKIEFTGGGAWEFEIPKANRKTAGQVVGALGGRVS
jgi:hypothetical protein